MRQIGEHRLLFSGLAIFGISILSVCVGFFVWKIFMKTPTMTIVPNTRGLTMLRMLKQDFVEHVDEMELTRTQLEKMRNIYARAIKINGPMNKLEKYRDDHPLDGTWQTGSSVIKCYIFTDNVVRSPEYYRKYIR